MALWRGRHTGLGDPIGRATRIPTTPSGWPYSMPSRINRCAARGSGSSTAGAQRSAARVSDGRSGRIISVVAGSGESHRQVISGTWLKEESFSTMAGRGSPWGKCAFCSGPGAHGGPGSAMLTQVGHDRIRPSGLGPRVGRHSKARVSTRRSIGLGRDQPKWEIPVNMSWMGMFLS